MEQVTEVRSTRGYFRSSPSSAFDQYLQDIQKLPLIDDPAEERRLARRAQRGGEDAAARLAAPTARHKLAALQKGGGAAQQEVEQRQAEAVSLNARIDELGRGRAELEQQ